MRIIPLIRPYMTDAVKQAVCGVLDSGHMTEGPVTRSLEARIAGLTGAARALAVTSCTAGLELALRVLGIGPGDEVILPDYTYPATADVVAIVGATPVLADVDPGTMLMDRRAAEAAVTARTRALMPVSLFGNPLDYDWIDELKSRRHLGVIEDAACSLGAARRGRFVGRFADISVFSLHPRKFITTGEGGIVTTDNPVWAGWMESYKHFGVETAEAERCLTRFVRVGANYKLSDVLAAIGLGQLEDFDALLRGRREQARRYRELLDGEDRVALPAVTEGGEHSWQTFCVFVPERDRVLRVLR
ncbi:MAG: DegT/DnrJ/EryC1/StrS family aminotransferase, partial [Desulfovibrio sp.]|nr:DegT/DnrJ/EryC1/StrS family aminotransferase [Desulfovibrio sp.]